VRSPLFQTLRRQANALFPQSDQIIVLTSGHILESAMTAEASAHDILLRNPEGAYSKLVAAQSFKEEEKDEQTVLEGARTPTHSLGSPDDLKDEKAHPGKEIDRVSSSGSGRDLEEGGEGVEKRQQGLFKLVVRMYKLNGHVSKYVLMLIAASASGCVYPAFGIVFASVVRTLRLSPPLSLHTDQLFHVARRLCFSRSRSDSHAGRSVRALRLRHRYPYVFFSSSYPPSSLALTTVHYRSRNSLRPLRELVQRRSR
jgi:hypothetical protein